MSKTGGKSGGLYPGLNLPSSTPQAVNTYPQLIKCSMLIKNPITISNTTLFYRYAHFHNPNSRE